jgi:phage terminase small subunit
MAGKPGKSGGSRPNTGGARPGAGRKPTPPVFLDILATDDPLVFLRCVMADNFADMKLRLEAAKCLMPYAHSKAELGKKDVTQAAAKKASSGRYGPSKPPLLAVIKH